MSELAATDLNALSPRAPAALPARAGGLGQTLRGIVAQPAVAKSLPLLGFVALLGIVAFAWMTISAAPDRTLFAGLADEDKAAVVEALNGGGIQNSIDRSTGAITVADEDYHRARMLAASRGLPRGGDDGGEVLSSMPLGSSRAVETERIRHAQELDLARTIEAIDVVQSARVHLAVAQPSVFVRERSRGAASVMLTLAQGRTIGDSQVQAIVNLVASSVPGLPAEGVSVVDQNGHLLSRTGADSGAGESERQLAVQTSIEDRYRQAVAAILTPIVGEGNFTAEVHAEMDFSEVQSTREGFPAGERVIAAEQGQVSSDPAAAAGASATAVGIPGALSNQPPPASEVAATPEGAVATGPAAAAPTAAGAVQRNENYNRTFALGREVSVTRRQPGTIKRVTVAVALRNPEGRPRGIPEMQALEGLVKGAVGFDQARGDVVALSARTFAAPTEVPAASWWEAAWVWTLGRNLVALAIVLALIFGIGRPLLRKTSAFAAARTERRSAARAEVGGEIASVLADRSRSDLDMKVSLEMIEATRDYEQRAALIRAFVRQDPARAALVVRDLIRTDANGVERHG
ncbi:MAG TPA: flagellar basal-body MS-ring/collar protein FliF [Allosphingosinicella sp.]|nr:flagellar basal-body MS-ring/collar protein FliF [Allosphingosinicella sp.]